MILLPLGVVLYVLLVKYSWKESVGGWKFIPFILAVILAFVAFIMGAVDTITIVTEFLARISQCYSST